MTKLLADRVSSSGLDLSNLYLMRFKQKIFLLGILLSSLAQATEYVVELKDSSPQLFAASLHQKSQSLNALRSFIAFGKSYVVVDSQESSQKLTLQSLQSLGASRIEENRVYQLQMGPKPPKQPDDLSDFTPRPVLPNDKEFTHLWGLLNFGQKIGQKGLRKMDSSAAQAWNEFRGSRDVVVGIMDTGVDIKHEDLQGNLWTRHDANNKAYYGYNALENNNDVMDWNNHGTHVAGTIGARGNNGVGVVGVNWEVTMVSVKIFSTNGSTSLDAILRGLDWFYKNSDTIKVINHSWGGTGYSQFIYEGFKLLDEAGVVNVVAAGNNGSKLGDEASGELATMYPAMYQLENSIVVAAHDNKGQRASFSNYSEEYVDIAAPGVDIRSSIPGNYYDSFSGTSMATPNVTGAVALLWSAEPSLTPAQLKSRILSAGEETPTLKGVSAGAKRLNILNLFK